MDNNPTAQTIRDLHGLHVCQNAEIGVCATIEPDYADWCAPCVAGLALAVLTPCDDGLSGDHGPACGDEIAALRAENQTLRNAQKACVDCDAPTLAETNRLRAENKRLRAPAASIVATLEMGEAHAVRGAPEIESCEVDADDIRALRAALGEE